MDLPGFWRQKRFLSWLLYPLSVLYAAGVFLQQKREKSASSVRFTIVVGNLTVGGNGKTPAVLALTEALQARGLRVGIVSRGHGRRDKKDHLVQADSSSAAVGDEALLLHRRSGAPVAVARRRTRAVTLLLRHHDVDCIISDDGLQHGALPRDYELVTVAGDLGWGNGFLLPAGCLREPLRRLRRVQGLIYTPPLPPLPEALPVYRLTRRPRLYRLQDGQPRRWQDYQHTCNVAFCSIARPERFFNALRQHLPLQATRSAADHAPITAAMLDFAAKHCLFITEKDAVKMPACAAAEVLVVAEDVSVEEALLDDVLAALQRYRVQARGD